MGFDQNLTDRFNSILSNIGIILFIGGLYIISPLILLVFRPEEKIYAVAFIIPALLLMTCGVLLWRLFKPRGQVMLNLNEGGIIVLFSWMTVIFFCALPISKVLHINLTQSIFESMSAWTTTGLSVVDVTTAPRIIILWRSIMQFAGGAGFAIIMLSSILGHRGISIIVSEGRTDQLVPNVRESARLVSMIYFGYMAIGIISYIFAGMSVFDAVNHTFTAVSTGGFSTYPDSIGHWDSFPIEIITILLMILGSLNFMTIYLLLQGRAKQFFRNSEVRLFGAMILLSACGIFFFLSRPMYGSTFKGVRVAFFETISAMTTSGFSTVTYQSWPAIGFLTLTVLMIIGGGTCSTAGGIKQFRIVVLLKSINWEIRRILSPRTTVIENSVYHGMDKVFIGDTQVRQIACFTTFYILVFVMGTAILTIYGYGLKESLFEFASALGDTGLSVGIASAAAPPGVLWTLTLGMFLGRMEFFIVISSFLFIFHEIRTVRKTHSSKESNSSF